mgnify:CR=1 FL=1
MATRITMADVGENLRTLSKGALLRQLHRLALWYAGRAETMSKALTGGPVLRARSGRLSGSIAGDVVRRKNQIAVRLRAGGGGDDVKYAKVHEQDGVPGTFFTIRAKNKPYLVFPIGADAFTERGVSRGTSSAWVSVRQVDIPSRPFLKPSMDQVEKSMIADVRKLLKGEAKI